MHWLHVHFHSETLGMPVQMEVLLPESPILTDKDYPVLYLLHDMGDGHTSWLRKTNIETHIEELSMAVVMPMGHLGYYTDMFSGKKYFSFITEELPAICERMFPLSEERIIAGNGIGGYGALKAGLLAFDKFKKAASFSAPIDIDSISRRLTQDQSLDIFGLNDDLKGTEHDLYAVEVLSSRTQFYLSCDVDDYRKDNRLFAEYLQRSGLSCSIREIQQFPDKWKNLDRSLSEFIIWLSEKKGVK
ncbi:S-formylglutathione hydrolase FrmB [Gracilibacillus ureilyticus]|uniref:S-formylglutathione hydrolase FrmB n=1 Tax=Gracilibacillus ureilyticus TaxID=531814 RepID=A0A1H9Q292_9BACI|nr:alpha/beta hydrolase-fold protein [Gracilibacillus ureilyticus]SER54587.1 S-formylglutathione hydrolase FrmB [Gracilibacillus ureilyticus]